MLDSFIRRKRWEYREQAIAHFSVYGEATSNTRTKAPPAGEPVIRGHSPDTNQGAPPFAALAKLGFAIGD